MTPSVLNRISARPVITSWIIGACVLDAVVLTLPSNGVRLTSIASDRQGMVFLILAIAAATGLGFFLGMFTCWPWIRPICSRFNGAPFQPGDRVVILTGPLRGTAVEVEDITKSQGGWDVVRLDLGPERRRTFSNIFEEYSLFRIVKGEPGAPPAVAHPLRHPSLREFRRPIRCGRLPQAVVGELCAGQ